MNLDPMATNPATPAMRPNIIVAQVAFGHTVTLMTRSRRAIPAISHASIKIILF